jgi:hypothetical protein
MAGLLYPATCGSQCGNCTFPAGSANTIVRALEAYPRAAQAFTGRSQPGIDADHENTALSAEEVVDMIDAGVPIIAGISPSRTGLPASEHVALIIGYRRDGEVLIVNDPFPFEAAGVRNPYLAAGARPLEGLQYAIDRDTFEDRLLWRETITVRQARSRARPDRHPNFCCTPFGRLGPYPNATYTEGDACYGTDPYARTWTGRACF